MTDLEVIEICAGAGGQALGLERSGFEHALAVELDPSACATLRANRPAWKVAQGDVADRDVWEPETYTGVDLLAGGVPCPPFTVAGRQLGATDERDLFAWAVELCGRLRPRALLLENVRGLATARRGVIRYQQTSVCISVVKLHEWAAREGVHYQTAWRWWRDGKLPVPAQQTATGTILVEVPAASSGAAGVVVYARVSSHDQRADLDRQVARVTEWVTGQGLTVAGVVREVGSGLNGKRPKLRRILSDPSAAVIVVEHRDRLARFGVEHLDAALAAHGRRLIVADPGETTDDLVRDMIEVLTSMCARLYGRRGARNRAMRAVTAARNAEMDAAA